MASIYYSPAMRGFFLVNMGDAPPADGVEVTQARHQELLDLQTEGYIIEPGPDGAPVAERLRELVITPETVNEWARTIIWLAYGDEALQSSVHRYMVELTAKKAMGQALTADEEADFAIMLAAFQWEQAVLDHAQAIIASGDLSGYQTSDWPPQPDGLAAFVASC